MDGAAVNHRLRRGLVVMALALGAGVAVGPVAAQSVSMSGTMGQRALLLIDGQTQVLGVGETRRGVTLLALEGDTARVKTAQGEFAIRVGAAPSRVGGGASGAGGREIVMTAGPGGHFLVDGRINGGAVRFMVDTGATMIAMGQADATRLGIDWSRGERGLVGTANGTVVAYRVNLRSVRVGDVEVNNVDAVVSPSSMPFVLLGNSFLSRFSMRRDSDVMRLELR